MSDKIYDFSTFPLLESARLILREPVRADLEMIWFLRSDEKVNEYTAAFRHKSIDETRTFLDKIMNGLKDGKWLYWMLDIKPMPGEENKVRETVGSICIWNFSEDRSCAEYAYSLHPKFQGRGYMSEAIKTTNRFAFENLSMNKIEAYTHPENHPSVRMLLANGFAYLKDNTEPDGSVLAVYELYNKR